MVAILVQTILKKEKEKKLVAMFFMNIKEV